MLIRHFVVATLSIGIFGLDARVASGQTTSTSSGQAYPDKPIRLLAAAAGGGADFGARLVAQELSSQLGHQVVVDNRGLTAIDNTAKAAPDGYTLLYYGSTVWLLPLMQQVSYDPVKDLAPISMVTTQPSVLVVHPSLPVKSVKTLIALAKARPGELNYASGPGGSSGHMAGELFKALAHVNIVRIPYKGTGPSTIALLSGEVQLTFITTGAVAPYLKSGRLRALAVTSLERSALVPDLPTIAASGVPGYESVVRSGLFAPAKTPAPIINRLGQETIRVLNRPDVREKFLNSGAEVVGSPPEQFAAAIKSEMTRMDKVIKDAGIQAE